MFARRCFLFSAALHGPAPGAEDSLAHAFGEGGEDRIIPWKTGERIREAILRPFDARQIDKLEHIGVRIRKHKVR